MAGEVRHNGGGGRPQWGGSLATKGGEVGHNAGAGPPHWGIGRLRWGVRSATMGGKQAGQRK